MRKFFLAVALALVGGGAEATTLDVVGGQLMGASGVDIGGTLYNVEFVDGSCVDLFGGCDDLTDFAFSNLPSAALAAQALVSEVFVDGASGAFASDPSLTNGCFSSSVICVALTPWDLDFTTSEVVTRDASNYAASTGISGSSGGGRTWSINQDSGTNTGAFYGALVYARWTQVPEPSSALLLCFGLLGVAGLKSRSGTNSRAR
jgi:hypothetical protein